MPKFNMYQSLHTTVIGPEGKPVEIQIRTHTMHRRAEFGVAAHWKYKEDPSAAQTTGAAGGDTEPVNDMAWLRQLLDWQKETSDPGEFLESLRFEINAREVYVFTPKGDVIALPSGATPVDFAYAVHTEVGHHCIGGRVNGRLVPLESTLENGDVVEILTSKAATAGPEPRLADVRQEPAGPQQDPPVVLQGAPRGGDRAGQGRHRQGDAQAGPADPAADVARVADCAGRRAPLRRRLRAVRGSRRESHVSAQSVVSRLVQSLGGEEGTTEDLAEATTPTRVPASAPQRRPGRRGQGRRRPVGQAGPLLHAGARRPDHRLRHPGQRRLGAPRGLLQRRAPDGPAGPHGRGRVGAVGGHGLPGPDPGRGARPLPAAVRRHARAVRRARQHPVGQRPDDPGPGCVVPLHLRDGRPGPPRPRAAPPYAASTASSTSTGSPAADGA